jgi:hypothetical protein
MKRQRRIPGAVVEISILDGNCYAQILDKTLVFFDLKMDKSLSDKELDTLMSAPVLFFASVYNDAITKGRWLKVGNLPIRDEFKSVPVKFIQDSLKPEKFELYDPNTGETKPSTYKECKDLECAAVWEAEHVEDRLRDHYNNIPNKWVESLKAKPVA